MRIQSPIFGTVDMADETQRSLLAEIIKKYPLDAFQILNKDVLNPKGLLISVEKIRSHENAWFERNQSDE